MWVLFIGGGDFFLGVGVRDCGRGCNELIVGVLKFFDDTELERSVSNEGVIGRGVLELMGEFIKCGLECSLYGCFKQVKFKGDLFGCFTTGVKFKYLEIPCNL